MDHPPADAQLGDEWVDEFNTRWVLTERGWVGARWRFGQPKPKKGRGAAGRVPAGLHTLPPWERVYVRVVGRIRQLAPAHRRGQR